MGEGEWNFDSLKDHSSRNPAPLHLWLPFSPSLAKQSHSARTGMIVQLFSCRDQMPLGPSLASTIFFTSSA